MDELDTLLKTIREEGHIDTTATSGQLVVEVDDSSILEVETPPRAKTTSDEHVSDWPRLQSLMAAALDGQDLHANDRDGDGDEHDENDQTTKEDDESDRKRRTFQEFITTYNKFAGLSYLRQLGQLPDMVKRIKELFFVMSHEIRLGGNATHFEELVKAFVRLVTSTRHNINLALPNLGKAKAQMEIMSEALTSSHSLSADDTSDIRLALNNMRYGVEKMSHFARESIEQSERLQECIEKLTSNIREHTESCRSQSHSQAKETVRVHVRTSDQLDQMHNRVHQSIRFATFRAE